MRTYLLTGAVFLLTVAAGRAQPPAPAAPAVVGNAHPEAAQVPFYAGAAPETRPFDVGGPRFWATGDYLLMGYTPMRTVPLIQAVPSAMANTGSSIAPVPLYPENNRINFGAFSGVRAIVGANWEKFGLEASGFALERKTDTGSFFNNGFPVAIAQGYISAGSGNPTSLYSSLPNQYSGGVAAIAQSRVWGADVAVRRGWYTFLADSTDLLFGVKYIDLQESLVIRAPSTFPDGSMVNINDSIRARNTFYGGYIGFNSRFGGDERGFGFDITSKSGFGDVAQRVELAGSNSFVSAAGVADVERGGLYARGLNAGTFTRDRFAFMQDFDLRLTYNFNRWVQVSVGYSLVYLSSAMRPGRAIDPVVNDGNARFVSQGAPSNLPRPAFAWRAEEFTVQGVTCGVRVQY